MFYIVVHLFNIIYKVNKLHLFFKKKVATQSLKLTNVNVNCSLINLNFIRFKFKLL